MGSALVECVPNFSCGREPRLLTRLVQAAEGVSGCAVLNASRDSDHNRAVLTLAAAPQVAVDAAMALARVACAEIDLRQHAGVHPRIGAADVMPFIPLGGASVADCVLLARQFGERLWAELKVPVFFYGAASMQLPARSLPEVRRGGFEGLLERSLAGQELGFDLGAGAPHPSAGATAVGVRPLLVAYNINLESQDVQLARSIAKEIRESNGGFPAVRALGLWLEGPQVAQVSINLCDFQVTGVAKVFQRVSELAARAGAGIRESELIGLAPSAALDVKLAKQIKLRGFEARKHLIEPSVRMLLADV